MTQDLEKAKKILGKIFCFMESQANDARERGEELMDTEDIEFLLSLDGTIENEILHCPFDFDGSLSKLQLLKIIQKAKNEKKSGVMLGMVIRHEDVSAIEKRGYFISMTGYGSLDWDEIYFSEDAFIRSRISSFKNLFDGLRSATKAHMF